MLKTRLITAGILLPLVVLSILYLPSFYFNYVGFAVFIVAAWEWTRLSGFETIAGRLVGLISMAVLVFLYWLILTALMPLDLIDARFISIAIILLWCLAFAAVLTYPKGRGLYASKPMGLIIGTLILMPACIALLSLKNASPHYLLYLIGLVCSADTGAYFAGRQWGTHKLAPKVSPGKTWEGVLGALLLSSGVICLSYYILRPQQSFMLWMLLGIVIVLFSIVGDLFESLFKRLRNLKDSGVVLPGHGGVLDRFDSLIPVMPIFIIGMIADWLVGLKPILYPWY